MAKAIKKVAAKPKKAARKSVRVNTSVEDKAETIDNTSIELENDGIELINQDDVGNETEDDLSVDYLATISDAVTWSTDWTIESLINQLERLVINLTPKFQRRDAWSLTKKSRFIESLIYGLPIPQIVLAESQQEKGRYIVVDGKQRLLTLKQFCSKANNEGVFKTLTKLKNSDLNGHTFESLEITHKQLFNNFINQSIRSVIIKHWNSETFLYTIFYRLNTGSLSLSPQELRRALKPGPFMDYVDDFASSSKVIQHALNLKGPDYRMRDMDLVIRYFSFAYRLSQYKGDYKTFLDNTCDFYNKDWIKHESQIVKSAQLLEIVVKTIQEVFKPGNSFKRWHNGKFAAGFNKAVFDIMAYYIIEASPRQSFKGSGSKIVEAFKNLCDKSPRFLKSISSNTNNLVETSTRFVLWGIELKKIIPAIVIPSGLEKIYKANNKRN